MAELDTSSGGGKKGGKVRSKKASTKVDLTAMVDLAFLLITFFMLTTSLSKPIAMDIAKPIDDEEIKTELRASETMTILLGKNNKVAWYMGEPKDAKPIVEGYSPTEIRKSILKNKADLLKTRGRQLIVVIKPTDGATYKNFVDIMDELHITDIKTAPAIDDKNILDGEKQLMREAGIL